MTTKSPKTLTKPEAVTADNNTIVAVEGRGLLTITAMTSGKRFMQIKYEPRDLWVGLYWTKARTTTLETDSEQYRLYVCIVPCFPIIFTVTRKIPAHKRHKNW